jgi:hypothetical protein
MAIKVGLGGQANLELHKKSQAHRLILEAKKYPALTNFFTAKPKPQKSTALIPCHVHNSASNSHLTTDSSSPSSAQDNEKAASMPSAPAYSSPLFGTSSMLPLP